jgi:aspartyl protease family protein
MRHLSLLSLLLLLATATAGAADINVIGLTAGKAVVTINNGKPLTLTVGQVSPEGVRLVAASVESATFEAGGRRQTLSMGQSISVGNGPVVAQRAALSPDSSGHFVTSAEINGISIRFMVDTGATLVTLSNDDARRAGINYLLGQKVRLQTANGSTTAYRVKIDTVRLGEIILTNVDGAVVVGKVMGETSLLGMSFLNRVDMRREGGIMTLTKRY